MPTFHSRGLGSLVALLGLLAHADDPPVQALEVGLQQTLLFPRGKEADGIRGDFLLKNGHLEAVIAGNAPGRKANMVIPETPGNLYDLCVAGSQNDQITLFSPGGLEGQVSRVSLDKGNDEGKAEIFVERTAARGGGHAESHRYRLESSWRHLLILSAYEETEEGEWKIKPEPVARGLQEAKSFAGISFADAMNPQDRQGYAWAPVAYPGAEPTLEPVTLKRNDRRLYAIALAPGRSPAEAFGAVLRQRGPVGSVKVHVRDQGKPVTTARFLVFLDEKISLPAYTDNSGDLEVALPPGSYRYALLDSGRPPLEGWLDITAGNTKAVDLEMKPPSRITFEVTDATLPGKKCPSKAQLIGLGLTPSPHLGPDIQAHGCQNQYHSENGWFTVQVPPGEYRVAITHGVEYSSVEKDVLVEPGKTSKVSAKLKRLVDTAGWVSADFHSHSTPSGDNYCGTDDRVINLAAENIEFAPTTEHNRFYNWLPHIQRLGLTEEISTVVGIELTGSGAHFNSFPFQPTSWVQDNGAPTWQKDPRINAIVLRDLQGGGADRYVQINHPSVGEFFRDRNADGIPDGGFSGLESLVDAAEVWSEEILNPTPWLTLKDRKTGKDYSWQNRTFAWLQLLNQGRHLYCVAVSDAHSVFGNGCGGWRAYLPSSTDDPSRIDYREVIRNAKAGRMFVTNGPFLEVKLADGTPVGGRTIAVGGVEVDVKVQCTDWVDINRVQVLVNGRQPPELNFTRARSPAAFSTGVVKFERRISVPLFEDAHLIVAAVGEGLALKKGYGESWQAAMHPCAFTNPIYVDVDGHGFQPNGDTLDQPLPTGKRP